MNPKFTFRRITSHISIENQKTEIFPSYKLNFI